MAGGNRGARELYGKREGIDDWAGGWRGRHWQEKGNYLEGEASGRGKPKAGMRKKLVDRMVLRRIISDDSLLSLIIKMS